MKRTIQEIFTPVLDFLVKYCTPLSLLYTNISFRITKPDHRFSALKDKYKGRRCFIVGLGPSLTTADLDLLARNREYTFSMNRCYQLFDRTEWRPDCYFISDGKACTPPTMKAIDEITPQDIRELVQYYFSQPSLYMISGNKEAIEANIEYLKNLGEICC